MVQASHLEKEVLHPCGTEDQQPAAKRLAEVTAGVHDIGGTWRVWPGKGLCLTYVAAGSPKLDHVTAMEATDDRLSEVYARFAAREARGRSPLYEELARGVAEDRQLLLILVDLPAAKQQPNLLFAAVRYVCGTGDGWGQFRGWVLERRDEIVDVIQSRRTQTNEPARCATLLPLLARLPQPLALLEVGAAAGLCLLPDCYGYDFDDHHVPPSHSTGIAPPTFACRANGLTPLPARNVDVAWRAGLDLDPIDLRDDTQVSWLEALVWPGEGKRLELLRAAVDVARSEPPTIARGDLRSEVGALAAQAPRNATLVVFHTAVLAYIPDPAERAEFSRMVQSLDAVWVANESPELLGGSNSPKHPWPAGFDPFLLTCDLRPVAWTDPHGTSIDWIAE